MKKYFGFIILIILLPLSLTAQEVSSDWVKQNYTKKEVLIPMRDGVRLFTAVYEPNDKSEKHPIMMLRTPYDISPYGDDHFPGSLWNNLKGFVGRHYIIVYQDVRGRYMSEGTFLEVRPFIVHKKGKKDIDESTDTYDTADWLLKHTYNNGCIGVQGSSYGGFYAAMAGFSGHPAIKAVAPQAPVTDWFMGDDIHHNGALMLRDAFGFLSSMEQPRRTPCKKMQPSTYHFSGDMYDDFLKAGAIRNLTATTGDSLQFWNDVVNHPDYDSFWQARNARMGCSLPVKSAVLVVGGENDAEDLYGTLALYREIQKRSPSTPLYLIFGPWNHGGWNGSHFENIGQIYFGNTTISYYQEKVLLPFFNHYLLGEKEIPAKKNIFFTGINEWKTDDMLPKNIQQQSFYFHGDGSLSEASPVEASSHTDYLSNPKRPVPFTSKYRSYRGIEYMTENQYFASRRTDVLSFQSEVLKDTLTLDGPIDVELYTSISTTDADFVVKVIDVYPDHYSYPDNVRQRLPEPNYMMSGYQMLLRGDVMRGKYRESFSTPQPFEPGKVTKVRFTMADVAHCFLPGHRLMVQVQSSWFPLVDRNPQVFTNIYTCKDSDFTSSLIHIYHQEGASSCVILPVCK